MRHDLLSDVLSAINNGDRVGKKETISGASKMVKDVLLVLQKHKYIGNFEHIDDRRGGKFRIELLGNVNSCGTIRPRHAAAKDEYEKWEHRYLPASGVGMLIISTSEGIMTHNVAKEKKIGGRLLAYIY